MQNLSNNITFWTYTIHTKKELPFLVTCPNDHEANFNT